MSLISKIIALVLPAPTVESILAPITSIKDKLADHASNQSTVSAAHTDNANHHMLLAELAATEAAKAEDRAKVIGNLFAL